MEERKLIERCRKNDRDAFETLILSYEKKIYNLCLYMVKNKEDAFDLTQETAIKIYKSISKFKGDSKFSTWVYRITYNTCLDFIKRKKDELPYDDMIVNENNINYRMDNVIESKETKAIIKKCIMQLNSDYRTVIILRDISGLSYKEISDILQIEIGTVKSRINRARQALKNELIKNGIARGC
ncbi:MAG TPA: RNA polymerase subunit sigma-24 [Clostridiaceae bacterium]|nr:RNA polymerase subunit sigma-24 [Clostridiaceae bacterium]